jgi:C-terminal processing protease CtpA/Prc
MKNRSTIWSATLGAAVLLGALAMANAPSAEAQSRGGSTWLGVYTQSLDSDLREGLDFSGTGVLITRVVDGSPAERAGLRQGDVITRVDGRSIDSPDALSRVVSGLDAGEEATVRIVRNGGPRDIEVTFEARPAQGEQRRSFEIRRDDDDDEDAESDKDDAEHDDDADKDDDEGDDDGVKDHADKDDDKDDNDTFMFRVPAPGDVKDLEKLKDLEGGPHTFNFGPDVDRMMVQGMGRGRLGVRIESMNEQLGEYFESPSGKGVIVMEVIEGTPAERAGFRAGDVITRVGSKDVDDSDDLIEALRDERGRTSFTVIRRGASRTLQAELDDSPATSRRWTSRPGDRVAPRARVQRNGQSEDEMRRELEELRRELRELKKELNDRD